MSHDVIFDYWLPILLALLISIIITCLKILKFHKTKYRFAFKSKWAIIILFANSVFSILMYIYFKIIGLKVIPVDNNNRLFIFFNGLFIASIIPFLANGIISNWRISEKKDNGLEKFVSIFTWINETIEPEIERFVDQRITEAVLKIDNNRTNIKKLKDIGDTLLNLKNFRNEKHRSMRLARLDELVSDKNFAGIVAFLLEYCSPEWLKEQINKNE